jgi:hypothetical protein
MPSNQTPKSLPTPTTIDRTELIADISLSSINTNFTMPTNGGQIPNDRFMYGLRLQFEGRITNNAAGPTGVQADAPFSLLESIVVEGFHRPRNQKETIYQIRGADARELCRIYSAHEPLVTPAPAFNASPASALNLAASGVNDIRFIIDLPFVPENLSPRQQIGWLLDAPNYDSLTLRIQFADDRSVFTGGTAGTFQSFGATTGSPRLRVYGIFAMAGPEKFAGFVPGRIIRTFLENTSGDIVAAAVTQSRQFNFPRGYRIRSVLIKHGAKSALASAGNNVYNTLSDTIFTNIQVNRGLNRLIRRFGDMFMLKEETGFAFGALRPSTGFGLLEFVKHGAQSELFDTTGLVAGPTGDTDVALFADVTSAAGNAALFLVQEARYLPSVQGRG